MGRNGKNSQLILARAIVPENPIRSRRFILGVRFKNLFSIWTLHPMKFMRIQGGMAKVRGHQGYGLVHSLENGFVSWAAERFKLSFSNSR